MTERAIKDTVGASHAETIQRLIEARKDTPGALLPLLHDIQDTVGYIPADCVASIAQALKLSRAEVHGVLTYYHHFQTEPGGRHVVQVCRAEACQSMGADALWSHACQRLSLTADDALHGATTPDAAFTLKPVYCLGLCSTSPAIVVNDRLHARVSCDDFDRLLDTARSAA
ncbi:formate dehydrogenase subunit gamma [Rhodoferax sp. GW822-FHT02A01]|uniref:formate dehydrogenase subunit gamma n=1 Tax=Rhodoferax sp. GW822-FHT02A01 TaxID=3141537 RepID=UPI00315D599B